ncbi:MAG: beta-ketoacyl-[acyl-carrier-protein] synthase family protein [Desulfobacterota bacterium]|nr:beta-ketoacyl-[acyl-carrier-protein] synthase family protein [Thermodesulfobacteriota bacterium]
MDKRAVITGMGVLSPIGIGTQANWENLMNAASGIAPFTRLSSELLPVQVGAEVKGFDPRSFITDRKTIRLTFHSVHLALAAAHLAFQDAGIAPGTIPPERIGAIIGSGGGGFDDGPGFEDLNDPILKSWDEERQCFDSGKFGELGIPSSYPLFLLKALPNNAFYYISLHYNIQGENDNIVSSYTGGAQAIGDAFRSIRRGLADVIIAGGYDSLITPNTIFSLDALGLLSRSTDPATACRPFDKERNGMIAGEGAGFFIIEDEEHARRRGARIYAEVIGYGNASSAYHLYKPDPAGTGIVNAVRRALEDAGTDIYEVDWICADGMATREADAAEATALATLFGDRVSNIPVSATKSLTGHMGSGAGAAESIYAVQTILTGMLPPTVNCDHPDPDFPLRIVRNTPQPASVRIALNINQGIGGQCTALLFRKYTEPGSV